MRMRISEIISRIILVVILSSIFMGGILVSAEETENLISESVQQKIFNGSLPVGEGNVAIKASSGTIYMVPVMSPLGVIQALAGTESIDSYEVGDELLDKRGILILDGINEVETDGDDSWFVTVNGRQLREFLIPKQEGLNTWELSDGDLLIFAYGNPTIPVELAKTVVTVQIGQEIQNMSSESTPIPESVTVKPTAEVTPEPIVNDIEVQNESKSESTPQITPVQEIPTIKETPTEAQVIPNETAANQTDDSPTSEPTPVIVIPKPIETESVNNSSNATLTPTPTVAPVFIEPEPTISISNTTDTVELDQSEEPVVNETKSTEDARYIFNGTLPFRSGTVKVQVVSGAEYDLQANSPLGVLQTLVNNGELSSISLSDRGMKKGGILILEGINDLLFTGTTTWFVQVNDKILQDYMNPETDGLNVYTVKSSDTIGFYYGDPGKSIYLAEAAVYVKMT